MANTYKQNKKNLCIMDVCSGNVALNLVGWYAAERITHTGTHANSNYVCCALDVYKRQQYYLSTRLYRPATSQKAVGYVDRCLNG